MFQNKLPSITATYSKTGDRKEKTGEPHIKWQHHRSFLNSTKVQTSTLHYDARTLAWFESKKAASTPFVIRDRRAELPEGEVTDFPCGPVFQVPMSAAFMAKHLRNKSGPRPAKQVKQGFGSHITMARVPVATLQLAIARLQQLR
jgi:hypothetical protein